jgi:hypothetical protein
VRARWHLSCCEYLGVGRSACIAPRTAHTSLPCERPGRPLEDALCTAAADLGTR